MNQNQNLPLIAGLGIGAGLMYLLDPDRGTRRRALLRDQISHVAHSTDDVVEAAAEDLMNRTRGLVAETGSMLRHEEVDNEVLVERVRSKLGRIVSHPSAIEVTAYRGRVTLQGPILKREVNDLISAVFSVRGVAHVENQLEVHEQPGNVPGLQGKARARGGEFELAQANWLPGTRLLVGSAGGLLAVYGIGQRNMSGIALTGLGLLLLVRGVTNSETARRLGLGGGRRAVDFHKTITVSAPVEHVFDFWKNVDNFPRFMAHVREVRDLGHGRSHWTVVGPAGTSVEWDAVITEIVPNKIIAWKSTPGSTIGNAGIIRFEATPEGDTRLSVRLSYNPPAGALGHAVAALFGADPKRAMDEDLVRFKSLVEHGKTSAHGETVTSTELAAGVLAQETQPGEQVH